jgi:subfamily B ATP-binding cassette protein MsbA
VFTIRGAVTYGHNVIMNSLGQRITSDANRDMFAHVIHSDIAFLHDQQSGRLLSRFINDTAMMRVATVEGLTGLGKNTFTIIGLVGVMFYQDWRLSLISILVFPVSFYFVSKIGRKLRKLSTNSQVYLGDMTSTLNQSLQGAKHIKSYVMEDYEKGRVNDAIEKIYSIATRSFRVSARVSPFTEIVSGLAIGFIIIYGGHQVIAGQSTEGKLFSFIVAFGLAYDPIKRLANLNNTMQSGLAAVDRFFKLLDIKPAIADKPGAGALQITKAVVRFENVSFSYPDGSEALRNVTLEAPAGKTIALVGESGAGKTTALGLIPRFYDVTAGAITIDGQDIRDVTMHSLRKNMALVSQEVAIFNDTIRDNIAYGRPGASEEDIIAAAKQAAAHEFISELSDGYNTRVGENGLKLSGGQRQRVSIARAMLKNAPILLLDEATSALDANSERLVQTALERLQQGRTTIVVAHRLSTIIGADIIYVMADGQVAEYGSHETLLAQGGAYARLYGNLMRQSA